MEEGGRDRGSESARDRAIEREIQVAKQLVRERQRENEKQRALKMAKAAVTARDKALKATEPLLVAISWLLQNHGRTLPSHILRGFVLTEKKLSTIVAALHKLASTELWLRHVESPMLDGLRHLADLAIWIRELIRRKEPDEIDLITVVRELNITWIEQLLLIDDAAGHTSTTLVSHGDPRLPLTCAGDLRPVGIDGPRKKLATWLMNDGEELLQLLPIVGPAGMGKTTLAMEIFRQIGGRFQCRAAVKVSRSPPDTKSLIQHIMSQIMDSEAPVSSGRPQTTAALEDDVHGLIYDVNTFLTDKRYLILLDDIWKTSDWETIQDAFPNNKCGSRVIITTRVRSVAHSCCSHPNGVGIVHEVKPLSGLDSERLFLTTAFGSEGSCSSDHLRQVSNEFLRRCDGVPLFIVAMASLLSREEQGEAVNRSAAYWLEKISEFKQVEEALSPSYDDLPSDLKLLSLYMSTFSQGQKIDKYRLIGQWRAEGLIAPTMWREFEQAAEENFSKLIERDIIRPVTCSYNSAVETCCQVNHFMLQFLVSESAHKNFLATSRTFNSAAAAGGGGNKTPTITRLVLHQPDTELPTLLQRMDLSHTHSLTVSGAVTRIPLDKFIHLVVLDLEGWESLEDDDLLEICSSKFFLLRYLSVRNTRVSKLPPQIKELGYLETLDISHTQISTIIPWEAYELPCLMTLDLRNTRVRQLPEEIVDLPRLRHLLINGDHPDETVTDIPVFIVYARFLETLATVDLSKWSATSVERLGDLRSLEVLAITWSFHQCTNKEYQKALRSAIQRSWGLKSLSIQCEFGCSMEFLDSLPDAPQNLHNLRITARFFTVPKWIQGLNHLVFLEITVCKLTPDDVKILGDLPALQFLVLGLDFLPVEATVVEREGFSELLSFSVDCRVVWLVFREGAMWKLTDLELKLSTGPASQESVPSGIANLFSLEQVALRYDQWYINSRSIRAAVGAMRRQVAELQYMVRLVNNGVEEDVEAILAETAGQVKLHKSETGGEAESEARRVAVIRMPLHTRHPTQFCHAIRTGCCRIPDQ